MSALFPFIPRLDAGNRGTAGLIDADALGGLSIHGGTPSFSQLGSPINTSPAGAKRAIRAMARHYARKWDAAEDSKEVQDAATDFVTSSLKLNLGPAEDIVRGTFSPYLFVPAPGRPPIIPSRNLLEPGIRTAAYKVRQPVGQASWVEPHATRGLLRAGYQVEEKEYKADWYGIAWGYSIPETWEANHLGEDLLGQRQESATLALDDFRERVSGIGDASRKIPGFFTLGDALIVLGGQRFSSGSVDAPSMIQRLAGFEHLYMRANDEMAPTGIVAPNSDRIAMQTTYFTGTSDTAWMRAMDQFPWFANVQWSNRMDTMSPTGTPRWAIYSVRPGDRDLYIEHTETLLFGPFEDRMDVEFVMLRRHGGVVSKYPERVMYVDFT